MTRGVLYAVAALVIGSSACGLVNSLDGYVGTDSTNPDADASDAEPTTGLEDRCPNDMVAVDGFCIDRTEVTQAAYEAFLSEGTRPSLPASCLWNTTFAPGGYEGQETTISCSPTSPRYAPEATPRDPVVCVDWCDAMAFCLSRNKRLCGRVGGGAASGAPDAKDRQWFIACSKNGASAFPYGDTYEAGVCRDTSVAPSSAAEVGSHPRCEGGYGGLFDMSGNVDEWEDACKSDSAETKCPRRGGDFGSDTAAELACAAVDMSTPDYQSPRLGFRCCRD